MNPRPITVRGPLRTIHKCPICGHFEVSRAAVRYDSTRAYGRIRTHIAACRATAKEQ